MIQASRGDARVFFLRKRFRVVFDIIAKHSLLAPTPTPKRAHNKASVYWKRPPLLFLSPPISNVLHRLMGCMHTALQVLHCRRSTIFFVVFAFLWNTGLV